MNERLKKLVDAAKELSPEERVELVEGVLESLDATDPRLDALWAEESNDRLTAYRRGEIAYADFDAVVAKHRRPSDR
ncbi:addiction module protein [Rhodobium gokarnense]|uniref:Addiction module component (TIGR02574 family) n=1 Tax=Rhodobium gokarnense TaxID=364296 RepID=A0ABT3H5V7_9HYPH|nr:addiction module protein [Rhodobium gokarnense]MCW2305767.1 putative addiction module component (TIGR02574 family) [Rhodobium gokarnense]